MIFHRALWRECSRLWLALFAVLLAIVFTIQTIRLLGQAASGQLAVDAVAALLAFSSLYYLPVLVLLAVFLAVLLALGRMYRDSEMVVWFSSGLSLWRWILPVLRFALPLALVVMVLSVWVSPWAMAKSERYRRQLDQREETATLAPGVFKEAKHANRVYFVESYAGEGGTAKNIFVQSEQEGRLGTIAAARGFTWQDREGGKFLVLQAGRRYEFDPQAQAYRVLAFTQYGVRVTTPDSAIVPPSVKALPSAHLWRSAERTQLAELMWRVGLPLGCVVLAVLAVPLSFVNPRSGRGLNLLSAILLYVTYSNLLSVSQAWVADGRWSWWGALLGLHGLLFGVGLLVLWRRVHPTWRRRADVRRSA